MAKARDASQRKLRMKNFAVSVNPTKKVIGEYRGNPDKGLRRDYTRSTTMKVQKFVQLTETVVEDIVRSNTMEKC
jgi:autonomous glycyl radical cofactor GrcA